MQFIHQFEARQPEFGNVSQNLPTIEDDEVHRAEPKLILQVRQALFEQKLFCVPIL